MSRGRPLVVLAVVVSAAASSAQTPEPAALWTLNLGVHEIYETDAPGSGDEGSAGFVTHVDTQLGRRFPVRRGGFQLGLSGGAFVDHKVGELRRFTWGVTASGSRALSRRAALEGQIGSMLGYGRDASWFDGSGAVPPYTITREDRAGVTLRHRLPADWEGRLEAHGERYVFDSPELVDGSGAAVEAGLGRGLSQLLRVEAFTRYSRTSSYGRKVEIGAFSGRLGFSVSRDVKIDVTAGLSRYRLLDQGQTNVSPTGSVGGNGKFGRHKLAARLSQGVGQTYGLGTVGVARTISVAYSCAVGRAEFTADMYDTRVSQSVVGEGADRARRFFSGVRYDFTRYLTGSVHYSFWARGTGPDQSRTHWVAATLQTHFGWR